MFKKVIWVLSILLICTFVAANNATIVKMNGDVEVFYKGEKNWENPRLYYTLKAGDKIQTKNGTAELVFNDGSVVNMKENSYLEIMQLEFSATKRVSVLHMLIGKIKARVTKFKEGSVFEVRSPTAIAAVKGTEFVVETGGNATDVIVLEGIVALSDILREKEVFIKDNERGAFKDNIMENPRELMLEEKINIKEIWKIGKADKEKYKESGKSEGSKEAERKDRHKDPIKNIKDKEAMEDKEAIEEEDSAYLKDIKDELFDLRKEIWDLRRDLADLRDRSVIDNKQDLLERLNDTQLGTVSMDVHGFRVRTEEYVLRPDPNTIQFLNLTKREDGPNAGISAMQITDVFNVPLPDTHFMDIKKWVDSDAWKNSSFQPNIYYLKQNYVVKNPFGDSIISDKYYEPVLKDMYNNIWRQPYNETFSINGSLKYREILDSSFVYKWINASNMPVALKREAILEHPLIKLADGSYLYRLDFSDGKFLETRIYVTDEFGHLMPDSFYASGTIMEVKNLYIPSSLIKFNYELEFWAPELDTKTIDVVVSPNMFKEYYRIPETTSLP